MSYDFTSILNRKGKDSLAVDPAVITRSLKIPSVDPAMDYIPMWIADMSFPVAPSVTAALKARIDHPIYGYFKPTSEYFDKIIRWHQERNGIDFLTQDCICYENSVLGGVVNALNIFASKGDQILVHAPTYIGFTNSLRNNGYQMVLSELKLDEDSIWRMDLADMEQKIVEHKIHTAIVCSPHNPCGRVWTRQELSDMMELFQRYDVQVISDEIWSDLTLDGYQHIPTQSISQDARNRTIAVYAPSKTFNLAGLVGSYSIIYNQLLRDKAQKEASLTHYNMMNVLSMHALLGAYEPDGYQWTDALCTVLSQNIDTAMDYISTFDGIQVIRPQATYLLYLDCSEWCASNNKTVRELLNMGYEVGVLWQDGEQFKRENTIRMNVALPPARLKEALERLQAHIFTPHEST